MSILIVILIIYVAISLSFYFLQHLFFFRPEILPHDFKYQYSFPFEEKQLQLTDGMVEYAYAMYNYIIDVHNGVRDPEDNEITADFTIPFQGTNVTFPVTQNGMRSWLTVHNGNPNGLLKEEDYWTPNLLNIYDKDGKLEILQFREVDERELNSLFLTYGWVYYGMQLAANCPVLGTAEIMDTTYSINQEIRARILVEPHAAKALLDYLGEPVDSYVNTKYGERMIGEQRVDVYRLFKGKIGDVQVSYVHCFCPSTGREFMLGVNNSHTNVKDAIASLVRVPKLFMPYIDQIFRQGEVFGFTTKDIDPSSKEYKTAEKSELVPLTGDFYFSKVAFES